MNTEIENEFEMIELNVDAKTELISSNFPEFRSMAEEAIKSLNFELTTKAEFARAEDDCKQLKVIEGALGAARDKIVRGLGDVNEILSACEELQKMAGEARLKLARQVTSEKARIKQDAIDAAKEKISIRVDQAYLSRIEGAAKGKRTSKSLERALADVVAEINDEIESAEHLMGLAEQEHGKSILHGEDQLKRMKPEALEIELDRRIERKRHEAEVAKNNADAAAKIKELHDQQVAAQVARDLEERKGEPVGNPDQEEQHPAPSVPGFGANWDGGGSMLAAPTVEEEWELFFDNLRSSMAPIKECRSKLVNDDVAEGAEVFARFVAVGFLLLKEFRAGEITIEQFRARAAEAAK